MKSVVGLWKNTFGLEGSVGTSSEGVPNAPFRFSLKQKLATCCQTVASEHYKVGECKSNMEVISWATYRQEVRERLFKLISNVIKESPDRSCWMSESTMARHLKVGHATVHEEKWQLINGGRLILEERKNGKRKNPKHRLTLPIPESIHKAYPAPTTECGRCEALPLVGFDLWNELERVDLIDCYLRSGWNVCPLAKLKKIPIFTRDRWSNWNCEKTLDFFYNNPGLGVGMWLDDSMTVFDFDSDRKVFCDTLISKRSDHSHAFFAGHPEIYNLSKINRTADFDGDIDTKARGGLVVLPPTVHESGMRYEWHNLVVPAPVPDSLLEVWRARSSGKPTGFQLRDLPNVIQHGVRNDTLWSYGRHLKATGASGDEIAAELINVNAGRCRPPLKTRELDRLIDHVWTHPNRTPHWM